MNDLNPDIANHEPLSRLARMAPEERVLACIGMFDTARALVESSLPAGLDPVEWRFRICQRFYGDLAARAYPRRSP